MSSLPCVASASASSSDTTGDCGTAGSLAAAVFGARPFLARNMSTNKRHSSAFVAEPIRRRRSSTSDGGMAGVAGADGRGSEGVTGLRDAERDAYPLSAFQWLRRDLRSETGEAMLWGCNEPWEVSIFTGWPLSATGFLVAVDEGVEARSGSLALLRCPLALTGDLPSSCATELEGETVESSNVGTALRVVRRVRLEVCDETSSLEVCDDDVMEGGSARMAAAVCSTGRGGGVATMTLG